MGRGRGVGWEWSSGCDCMEVRFSFIASNDMSWYLSTMQEKKDVFQTKISQKTIHFGIFIPLIQL
jgi:hypothetical protein